MQLQLIIDRNGAYRTISPQGLILRPYAPPSPPRFHLPIQQVISVTITNVISWAVPGVLGKCLPQTSPGRRELWLHLTQSLSEQDRAAHAGWRRTRASLPFLLEGTLGTSIRRS